MSKLTTLQRRAPEENSTATLSASAKRRPITSLTMLRSKRTTITCCPVSSKSFC